MALREGLYVNVMNPELANFKQLYAAHTSEDHFKGVELNL